MQLPLVSVIVAIYNGEKYLKECVNSIISQEYKNIEIILVDDGSNDNSRDICSKMGKEDKRIKVIFRETNGGVSECRLSGLNASNGEWIMFVDHDDTIPNDCIETFVRAVGLDDNIEVVCGDVSETYERKNQDDIPEMTNGIDVVKEYFEKKNLRTSHESKMYKKGLLQRINVSKFRERCPIVFFDDILITPIILGEASRVAILPGIYYLHREVMTSISRSKRLNSFMFDHMEAGDIMLQYFKKKQCNRSYAIKLMRYYQDILRIYCLMDFNNVELEEKRDYEDSVIKYYNKYFDEFKKKAIGNKLRKASFMLFHINPNLWKVVVQKTYYRNYQRE